MSTSRDPKFKSEKVQPAAALSRREFVAGAAAAAARGFVRRPGQTRSGGVLSPYGNGTIPAGIRARTVPNVNGLTVHVLEAGFDTAARPAILLLHGYPELAYSWRKVMLPLAEAGYHVAAPDHRGYGRSGGTDVTFDDSLWPWRPMERVRDTLGLVYALGHRSVAMIVGHDFGSAVSGWSTLIRPDVFRSMVLMTGPFEGAPSFPFNSA